MPQLSYRENITRGRFVLCGLTLVRPSLHTVTRTGVSAPHGLHTGWLQCVQVCQQVFDLLVGHDPAEAFHFGSSKFDDVGYTIVVGGQSAQG
jgi:hypothetical protein